MYAWYKRTNENGHIRLLFERQTSIAGCNNGIIASELKEIISPVDNAPFGWTIPIADKWNKEDLSFIVDIKPNAKEIFLCELDRVFGYCYDGWSPIMLRLKTLLNDEDQGLDKKSFFYTDKTEIIYTMYYLYGSVKNGQLVGTWNPPWGTITALLFWPEAMTFFFEQVKISDNHFLSSKTKLMTNWGQYDNR